MNDRQLVQAVFGHELQRRGQIGVRTEYLEWHTRHDVADGRFRPRILAKMLRIRDADDANQSSAIHNRQRSLTSSQRVLEHEVSDQEIRRCNFGRCIHDTGHWYAIRNRVYNQLLACSLRAVVQEPADERDPQATKQVAAEDVHNAPTNQDEGNRAQHAAAVERESWHDVEQAK